MKISGRKHMQYILITSYILYLLHLLLSCQIEQSPCFYPPHLSAIFIIHNHNTTNQSSYTSRFVCLFFSMFDKKNNKSPHKILIKLIHVIIMFVKWNDYKIILLLKFVNANSMKLSQNKTSLTGMYRDDVFVCCVLHFITI